MSALQITLTGCFYALQVTSIVITLSCSSYFQDKIAFGSIKLAPGAVLVLDGPDITVKGPLAVRTFV
jgi:hypothetical protein